jgi:iron(II)-dependent oxidoreductase
MATQAIIANDRHLLIPRLAAARAETDAIFRIIRPEAIYDRPIAERHRILFYVGHVEAFDWNLLSGPCGLESSNPGLDRLFAFGIDPVDGNLPSDKPEDWPDPEAVMTYRMKVRRALDQAMDTVPSPELYLNAAIEHRLMHAETLAYMFHQMSPERKVKREVRRVVAGGARMAEPAHVAAGSAVLGLRRDSGEFGWCNEFEQQIFQLN